MAQDAEADQGFEGLHAQTNQDGHGSDVEKACRTGRPVAAIEGELSLLGQVASKSKADVAVVEDRAKPAHRPYVMESRGRCDYCDDERRQPGAPAGHEDGGREPRPGAGGGLDHGFQLIGLPGRTPTGIAKRLYSRMNGHPALPAAR